MRSIQLPKGVEYLGSTKFNPNVGLEYVAYAPLPKEETLLKANATLAKFGYSNLNIHDFHKNHDNISAEVGDDEEVLTDSKGLVAMLPHFHEQLGMKVSQEDTSINSRFGNFAEDLIVLPDGYGQTYLNARKTSSSAKAMSFIDIPKLRLAIDIRPMRMDHSGTNDGKASMVGSRQRWIPLESNWRGQYELFSLYQDINLGLHRDKKYPYFPASLGGYGKEPPFRNYINCEKFMKAFKQGSHSELIREVVYRTIDYFSGLIQKRQVPKDPLLSHLVRFQSSFHDWVKGRSIYAPVTWADVPPEVAQFQVGKLGRSPHEDEAISRLLAERKILSESQLEIAVEHNELCKALLGSTNINEFKKTRDTARKEWNNLSIFSRENYGIIEELGLIYPNRLGKIPPYKYKEFYTFINNKRYNLRHILRSEFVYDARAMDEIYKVGPMKVNFEMYPRVGDILRGFAANSQSYRTDCEDTEEIGALDELLSWLKSNFRTGKSLLPVPRKIINDDIPLIRECNYYTYNFVITDDIRLCREINRETGNAVFRVPCSWYYKCTYFGTRNYSEFADDLFPGLSWQTHEDSGSIKAFEESHFLDGVMLSKPAFQKFNFWKDYGTRDSTIYDEFLEFGDEPPCDVSNLLFDKFNLLRTRRNRPRQRGQRGG